jgi:glycerophosphoryl diester phosphodiesterase
MRFFEFSNVDANPDKLIILLKNHIGRASSKKVPSFINWRYLSRLARDVNFEFTTDFETFKAMYDANPILQTLVKDFNKNGIQLKIPGVNNDKDDSNDTRISSQDRVDQTAAAAAPAQLDQLEQTPLQK